MMFFAIYPGAKADETILIELVNVNLLRCFYRGIEHLSENLCDFLSILVMI